MPAAKTASPMTLNPKYANRVAAATTANKDNEIDYGFGGDLPAGINNGIAQLAEIKVGEYKEGDRKGEKFLRIAGVVKSPATFNGERIEGKQVAKMIPLCDDPPPRQPRRNNKPPKTFDDRIAELINEYKLLGAEEAVKQLPPNCTFDHYLALGGMLVKAAPHFKFRTWAIADAPTPQNPNPQPGRTNVNFQGMVQYDPNSNGAPAAVQDNSGAGVQDNSEPSSEAEPTDWTTLGESADNGDEGAAQQITEAGEALGLTSQEKWQTGSYADAAAMIIEAESGAGAGDEGGAEPDAPAEADIPQKDEVCKFRPQGARKDVECQITAVFEKAQTVNLKRLDNNQLVRSVQWDKLIR